MHEEEDEKGMFEYYASHALISDQTLDQVLKYCSFAEGSDDEKQPKECDAAMEIAYTNVGAIDIYNIYAPSCTNTNLTHNPKKPSVSY